MAAEKEEESGGVSIYMNDIEDSSSHLPVPFLSRYMPSHGQSLYMNRPLMPLELIIPKLVQFGTASGRDEPDVVTNDITVQ